MNLIPKHLIILSIVVTNLLASITIAQEPIDPIFVTGPGPQYAIDQDIDSQGNRFITGYTAGPSLNYDGIGYNVNGDGDAYIAKLDSNDQLLWFKPLGGNHQLFYDEGLDIHVDVNDDIIIVVKAVGSNFTYNGSILSGVNGGSQPSGAGLIIKLDNNGNYLWHDDGSNSSSFQKVVTDSAGNVYLTGWFQYNMTLGDSIQLSNPTIASTTDFFIAKYSPNGNILWAKNVGGTVHNTYAYGLNIAIDDTTGQLVATGRYKKTITFETGSLSTTQPYSTFLVAYDDSVGTELWAKSIFNNGYAYCLGLDISSAGVIGVAGYNSLYHSAADGLVGFYDLNGNVINEEVYLSTFTCHFNSLNFNQLNECYITGEFRDTLSVGLAPNNIELYGSSTESIVVVKLSDNHIPVWASQIVGESGNNITCRNNRIFLSGNYVSQFIYNYGADTANTISRNGVFAEIADTSCPLVLRTDTVIECNGFTWIDGKTYTSSNDTAEFFIAGGAPNGCNILISLDLTINKVSDISTIVSNNVIIANNQTATYQWLDCDNNFAIIDYERGQSFSPIANGNYAVQLSENGCVDTSSCVKITSIGIVENDFGQELSISPNPSSRNFLVDLGESYSLVELTVTDVNGKTILKKTYHDNRLLSLEIEESKGLYLLMIEAGTKHATALLLVH